MTLTDFLPAQETLTWLETQPEYLKEHWCVPPTTGRFLHLLVLLTQAQRILEVGTSIGYSTLWLTLAAAQTGGQVETIDASEKRLALAQEHLQRAQLSNHVQFHLGDALTVLESLKGQAPYELMFIDARKSEYLGYFESAQTLVSSGGLLIADNTLSHAEAVAPFMTAVSNHPQWTMAHLEVPHGLVVALKR